jgi:hypothetical protein
MSALTMEVLTMTTQATQASWKRTKYTTMVTLPSGRTKQFDMEKLYIHVDFAKMDTVELDMLEYGVKQKLADSLTQLGRGATDTDKFTRYDEMWTRLCKDRQFNSPTKGGGGPRIKQLPYAEFKALIPEGVMTEDEIKAMYAKTYPTTQPKTKE